MTNEQRHHLRNTTFVLKSTKLGLCFHIPHTPHPPIQFLLIQTLRAVLDDSSNIKSIWIEGWGERNNNDERC